MISPSFKAAVLHGTTRTALDICVYGAGEGGANLHILNSQIVTESMTVTQAICDEPDLKFGGCVASSFEIEISKDVDLTGKYITVYATQRATMPTYPGEHCLPSATTYPGMSVYSENFAIFSGEVFSCKKSKNKLTRQLIAYDRFYWRGAIDCTSWYHSLYANTTKITAGDLRTAILTKFKIRQQKIIDEYGSENYDYTAVVPLPGDDFELYKMESDSITVADLLRMLGEISGVFLWLNGAGNLEYITISDNGSAPEIYDYYIDVTAEEFEKTGFGGLDVAGFGYYRFASGDDSLLYQMDNPLMTAGYDESRFQQEFNEIKTGITPNFQVEYTPSEIKAQTRLWLVPGDRYSYHVKWYSVGDDGSTTAHDDEIVSVILSRRITGIQAMTDEITAQGEITPYSEDTDFE